MGITKVCSICCLPYNAIFTRKNLANGELQRTRSPIISAMLPNKIVAYVHRICLEQSESSWKHVMRSTTRKERRSALKYKIQDTYNPNPNANA